MACGSKGHEDPVWRTHSCEHPADGNPTVHTIVNTARKSACATRCLFGSGNSGLGSRCLYTTPALHSLFMVQFSWPETALFLVPAGVVDFRLPGSDFAESGESCCTPKKIPSSASSRWDAVCATSSVKSCCKEKSSASGPLPGLAHAFVFWGFCAFALVTINHFAEGVGLASSFRAMAFSEGFYFTVAAIFGVLVADLHRRTRLPPLVIRPKWLGPLS